jgi:hypothetical protein
MSCIVEEIVASEEKGGVNVFVSGLEKGGRPAAQDEPMSERGRMKALKNIFDCCTQVH